jgi:predicted ArsR family transcriptional regulator
MNLQEQARALGDPTRHAIYRHLSEAARPLGITELTDLVGVTHNAIRQHLAKLADAGLVLEGRAAPAGRGRPRLVYEVHPAAAGAWAVAGPYERLSRLLVEIIRTGRTAEEVGRAAADEFRVPVPTGDGAADIHGAMARQGFEPETVDRRLGPEVVLHTCPFESVAQADRATVCALHLGIAEGLADGTSVVVKELVANDPRRAACRIRLAPAAADEEPPTLTLRGGPRPS